MNKYIKIASSFAKALLVPVSAGVVTGLIMNKGKNLPLVGDTIQLASRGYNG